ncbi:ABC transporter permease [Corynebacterium sp. 35RC1]|nr:ABC transporter permease [Corynebacterium sp. 35RC1]
MKRIIALSRAETLQFLRNRTVLVMALLFPVGTPVILFYKTMAESPATAVLAFEMFTILVLLIGLFYAVLSMATARRGEGVLKRLRTGECQDWEILVSIAMPTVITTVLQTVVMLAVMRARGAVMPQEPLWLVVAMLGGTVLYVGAAYLTSVFTKTPEAAQFTAFPVMVGCIVGTSGVRQLLSPQLQTVVDFLPFTPVNQLVHHAWLGDQAQEMFSLSPWQMSLVLLGWGLLSLIAVRKTFRWEAR